MKPPTALRRPFALCSIPRMGGNRGAGKAAARRVAIVLVLGLMAAGCASGPPDPSQVTGLHFTASSSLASNPPPAVDVTVTEASPARAIYALTLALPQEPSGTYHCPADFGVRYRLDFMSGASTAVIVTANPSGCGEVLIPGTTPRRALTSDHWAAVAQNLGIDESTIYPYQPQ